MSNDHDIEVKHFCYMRSASLQLLICPELRDVYYFWDRITHCFGVSSLLVAIKEEKPKRDRGKTKS